MYTGKVFERTIQLRSCLCFLFMKWKYLLTITLVCTVLMGIYGCVRLKIADTNMKQKNYKTIKTLEVSNTEFANIKSYIEYEEVLLQQQYYNENSVAMQIDPSHKYTCGYNFKVSCTKDVDKNLIHYAYQDRLNSNELYQYLNQALGVSIEESFWREIILVDTYTNPDVIYVEAYHFNKTDTQKICEAILNYMKSKTNEIGEEFGSHELVVEKGEIKEEADLWLESHQNNNISTLVFLRDTLAARYANLTSKEIAYLEEYKVCKDSPEYIEGEAIEKIVTHKPQKYKLSISNIGYYVKKGSLFGAVLGIITFIGYYIFSPRVLDAQNVEEIYDIPMLGKTNNMKDENLQQLSTRIELLIKSKSGGKELAIVYLKKDAEEILQIQSLIMLLTSEKGLVIQEVKEELDKIQKEEAIYNSKSVLLFVGIGETKWRDIDECVRQCGLYKKTILGTVFL